MNTPQFPPAFASRSISLGAPRRYFPVKNWHRTGSLVAFFVCMAGAILALLVGLYVTYPAFQKHGPVEIDARLTVPAILAFMLLLLGLAAGLSAYRNWNKGVAVYEHGMAFRSQKGLQAWPWEQVVSLTSAVTRHYTSGIFTGTTHVYRLFNRLNQSLRLNDSYTRVEELAQMIQAGIYPFLYDQAAQQYNSGQALVFGPVTLNRTGIQLAKKTYPWTEVQQVSIHQGILKVTKKDGGWFSGSRVSAAAVPNLEVLLNLIHQVVGLKVG